jgi:hypothetical protein
VRDDPAVRISLMGRCYQGPFGEAPRHLPFRRAAMSFMRWRLRRGVLQPPFSDRPGSPWWPAVDERLSRVLPDEYPLPDTVRSYLGDELGFGHATGRAAALTAS